MAMGISMLGLVLIEIYWVRNAVDLRKGQLTRDVNDIIAQVSREVEIQRKERSKDISKLLQQREQELFGDLDSLNKAAMNNGETWNVKIIEESTKDSSGKKIKHTAEKKFGAGVTLHLTPDISSLSKYSDILELQKAANLMADSALIDRLLKTALQAKGIDAPFQFAVFDNFQNIIIKSDSSIEIKCLLESKFRKEIGGRLKSAPTETLAVIFPEISIYGLGNIWVMLIASSILILVMVSISWYTLHSILVQKKLSDIRSDFISNMTHEFKTPISTISLACEALTDPEVDKTEEKVFNYIGIIHDENKRLSLLVENVLQTALIEKDGLKLRLEKLNLNQLIQKVCNNMWLTVEKKGGELLINLDAEQDELMTDKVHITNVIFNLLDNALKYSYDAPLIVISTRNQNKGIVISVSDNGIGIGKEDKNRIFEKFYRVSTGNVHDVKGFGLGLSYVKAIVDLHQGEIHIDSELGKGSTFEIFLPFGDIHPRNS